VCVDWHRGLGHVMSVSAYLVDGVHVRVSRTKRWEPERKYVALAKREPFVLAGLAFIDEPGEVWFRFGGDRAVLVDEIVAEVKAALRRELRRPVNKTVVVERAREDLGDEGEKVRWIITSRIEGEE